MRRPTLLAFTVSLLLHAYVGVRLLPALSLSPGGLILAVLFLVASGLLMPAPLMIRLSGLPERAADVLAWSGYLAMGVFSSLIVLCLLRDALLLRSPAPSTPCASPTTRRWRSSSSPARSAWSASSTRAAWRR
jgi:hypothetical protein